MERGRRRNPPGGCKLTWHAGRLGSGSRDFKLRWQLPLSGQEAEERGLEDALKRRPRASFPCLLFTVQESLL